MSNPPKPKNSKPKSSKPKSPKKPAGRTKGTKNIDRVESTGIVSRCPKCNSTNREAYSRNRTVVQNVAGTTEPGTGNPVTHMIFRTTKCTDCGQHRRDISYLFDPKANEDQIADEAAETGPDQAAA